MTQDILLVQVGLGGVGRALVQQVLDQQPVLNKRYGLNLHYRALLDSSGALCTGEPLSRAAVQAVLDAKQAGQPLATQAGCTAGAAWFDLLPDQPCIIIDVTSADGLEPHLIAALTAGHRLVLSNKRPLSSSQANFDALVSSGRTRYEATVGAGLPVIHTMQSLFDSGDQIERIEAAMSGTLGYLCTAIQERMPLSEAVRTARSRGWTEADPRDDLSGADVARKALILARTAGLPWEMADVPVTSWYPSELAGLTVEAFMDQLADLDAEYTARAQEAWARDTVLRYVATLTTEGASIGWSELPSNHPLALLRGTDNLFSFGTRRYHEHPLVIRGPGAGIDVTAAGVLADVVATAREM
jgi:homoserine dehydrogenase